MANFVSYVMDCYMLKKVLINSMMVRVTSKHLEHVLHSLVLQ